MQPLTKIAFYTNFTVNICCSIYLDWLKDNFNMDFLEDRLWGMKVHELANDCVQRQVLALNRHVLFL
jgi:hypothetical protein